MLRTVGAAVVILALVAVFVAVVWQLGRAVVADIRQSDPIRGLAVIGVIILTVWFIVAAVT